MVIVKYLFLFLSFLLALASLALLVVAARAGFTSDGPGMLFIFIGIFVTGFASWLFGSLGFALKR
ncbi:MAG TPA: hypothetical protein VFV50_06565 [Bdellovibrionales bacterium]|nr:hypothetical protein [Bdellovibrionales bacterium]